MLQHNQTSAKSINVNKNAYNVVLECWINSGEEMDEKCISGKTSRKRTNFAVLQSEVILQRYTHPGTELLDNT